MVTLPYDGNVTLGLFPARVGNRHYPNMAVFSTATRVNKSGARECIETEGERVEKEGWRTG